MLVTRSITEIVLMCYSVGDTKYFVSIIMYVYSFKIVLLVDENN